MRTRSKSLSSTPLAGMKAYPVTRLRDDLGFPVGEFAQPSLDDLRRGESSRQFNIDSMMSSLAREQRAIEPDQRLILDPVGQQAEALAAARLDERGDQQDVDQSLGFISTRERMKGHPIGTRADRLVSDSAPVEMREDLLKMIEFFPREIRKRFLEESIMRIGEQKFNSGARRLLLAMSMIEQHVAQMGTGSRKPFGRRIGGQMQHDREVYRERSSTRLSTSRRSHGLLDSGPCEHARWAEAAFRSAK